MKRPPICCDSREEVEEGTHHCNPQGSGTMARVRRFLTLSLGGSGGRHLNQSNLPPLDRPCMKTCDDLPLASSPRVLHSLKAEAELVLGKSLEDIISEEEVVQPYGVPSFLHSLCCYMLTNGVDYEILVSVDWCSDEVKSSFLMSLSDVDTDDAQLPGETGEGASFASGLFRLFLQELPEPLLNRDATLALSKIRKGLNKRECDKSEANRIRNALNRKLPLHNKNLIQYLSGFLYQLRTANHNTCPVSSSALSRVLARALTEEGKRKGAVVDGSEAQRLAEMLLLNYALIFDDGTRIVVEHHRNDDYSDSVSSTGETNDEDGDLASTEEDDEGPCIGFRESLPTSDDPEDESTTTTDTDDFRSPPISPLNRPFLTPSPGIISRCLTNQTSPWLRIRQSDSLIPLDPTSPVTLDPGAPLTPSARVVKRPADKRDVGAAILKEPKGFRKESKGSLSVRKRKGRSDESLEGHDPKTFRSTNELPDVESFHTKIVPFMKDRKSSVFKIREGQYGSFNYVYAGCEAFSFTPNDRMGHFGLLINEDAGYAADADCLPSITGFISPDEPWKEEVRRSENYDMPLQNEGDSSCLSGGEISELEESEGSRDADGSDTEGAGLLQNPCPHEERRISERFSPRAYKHSSGRKSKRKTRRRHSKDSVGRPSSEEEEKESMPSTGFTSPLSREDDESVCSEPTPSESEISKPFRDLLASNDPVQSDRSSWCLRGDVAFSDNWQRTAHHYSREDDVKPLQSANWYRADNGVEDFSSLKFSDFSASGIDDFLNIPQGQNAVKLLSKHISGLKKKIKKFEEEFENKAGYRPSHQDKMKHEEIKKQMSALSRLKKELKYMKEEAQEKRRSSSKGYPMSLLRCQESTAQPLSISTISENVILAQETLRQVEGRLSSKRGDAKRPTELSLLSLEQYHDEKTDLQKALLYYESKHGRPVTREDRDRVRPLYDRYRQVKRGIVRFSSRTKENIELAPILEGEAMDFTLASPQHRGSLQEEEEAAEFNQSGFNTTLINLDPHPEICPFIFPQIQEVNLGDLHALPIHELKERKREAREMKKSIRCALREFEVKFEKETGRKLQKEDRGPMEHSYTEYKHVKAKLRLLEALLSKHSNSFRCES